MQFGPLGINEIIKKEILKVISNMQFRVEALKTTTFVALVRCMVQKMMFWRRMLTYTCENQPKLFYNYLILTQYSMNFQSSKQSVPIRGQVINGRI